MAAVRAQIQRIALAALSQGAAGFRRKDASLVSVLEIDEYHAVDEVLEAMKFCLDTARKAIAQVDDGGCKLRA